MAFEFEQFEGGDAFGGGELRVACCGEEASMDCGGAIEDDVDVGVARGPEIFEERLGELLRRGVRWRRGG